MEAEIHLKGGVCKVYQGPTRLVFYSTEEAVGLALLKMDSSQLNPTIQWTDLLASHGVATGITRNKSITLLTIPSQTRKITWGEQTLEVTFPPLLLGVTFEGQKLVKSKLYVVKSEPEKILSIESEALYLAYFPYGNVYDTGSICWGTTNIGDIHYPLDAERAFFTSGFNNDLWAPRKLGILDGNMPTLLTRLKSTVLPMPTEFSISVESVAKDLER